MHNFPSLKKNKDFQLVYKAGKSYANKQLVMYIKKNNTYKNRLGVSVSKKVGNSIVRHHLVRLVRESFRLHQTDVDNGYDIVVVIRITAAKDSFEQIERSYIHLCGLHGITKKTVE